MIDALKHAGNMSVVIGIYEVCSLWIISSKL